MQPPPLNTAAPRVAKLVNPDLFQTLPVDKGRILDNVSHGPIAPLPERELIIYVSPPGVGRAVLPDELHYLFEDLLVVGLSSEAIRVGILGPRPSVVPALRLKPPPREAEG